MPAPFFILGATAVGKSEVALRLAEEWGAVILVMDAMQVYSGLEIGVNKPSSLEKARVPHAGLDILPWSERFDTARYVAYVKEFLSTEQRPVIICGGTGLYFRALTQGFCEAPAAPQALREELSSLSLPELQDRLQSLDPRICRSLEMSNPRRVQRALEVIESTGRSLAEWQAESAPPVLSRWSAVWLDRPREEMRNRIQTRTDQMISQGWLAEVERLLQESGEEKLAKCPAIGYKELMMFCLGKMSLGEATETIVIRTSQYAKRQQTWFGRESGLVKLQADSPDLSQALRGMLIQ